jgi:hypothetical protein
MGNFQIKKCLKSSAKFFIPLFISSCCMINSSEFEFSKEHLSLIENLTLGDTVFFRNEYNDYDTIKISNIDIRQECGGIMGYPHKTYICNIKHLPKNIYYDGTVRQPDGTERILDQNLITISKFPSHMPDKQYSVIINFRDFSGEIISIDKIKTDSLFHDFGVQKYWEITSVGDTIISDSSRISKVYWSQKFGLTGYHLYNGAFYKRVID